jgi:hypothetical protein
MVSASNAQAMVVSFGIRSATLPASSTTPIVIIMGIE